MKLTLPTEPGTEKKYRHFSFESPTGEENRHQLIKREAFFYIGTDAVRIEKLVKILEGRYVVENVASASLFVKRIKESNSVPEAVMVDGKLGKKGIKEIYNYLSSVAGVPLLIDASDLSGGELKEYRKIPYIDEIFFLKDITVEKLISKIAFLKKVKSKPVVVPTIFDNIQQAKKISTRISNILKRAFDILFASIAILVLLPIFLIIALLIRLESKGPIFYVAARAGKGYKIFKFYKFRTMVVDADKKVSELTHLNQYGTDQAGPVFFKISKDPRITRVGAILRNTSLDELPQLLNVLLGDMSLVGNRPLPLYEAATLTTDAHAVRFMAPAGITGLWQIKKRGCSNMSVEERINLDIDYANKSNFIYDLWIIANTPSALLQKESV
jgi:lipopolysaccharide/colanic/teichoic acid biosynthesis glycosyltransferase